MNQTFINVLIILLVIAVVCAVVYFAVEKGFLSSNKVRQWLLFACSEAERALGSGTGQLKLRKVYDMFVARFPLMALIISFETFSRGVDLALDQLQEMIDDDDNVKESIQGAIPEVKEEAAELPAETESVEETPQGGK